MLLRVELMGKLPGVWDEYVEANPRVTVICPEPLVLRLNGPAAEDQLSGVISAMGRLNVPASAVYLESGAYRRAAVPVTADDTEGVV